MDWAKCKIVQDAQSQPPTAWPIASALDLMDCDVTHVYHCDLPLTQHIGEFPADALCALHTLAECRDKLRNVRLRRFAHTRGHDGPTIVNIGDTEAIANMVNHCHDLFTGRPVNAMAKLRRFFGHIRSSPDTSRTTWRYPRQLGLG